jgi:hypothetical protein
MMRNGERGTGDREQGTEKREGKFVLSHSSTMKLWMNGPPDSHQGIWNTLIEGLYD